MANVQVIQRHAHLAGAVKLEFVNGREGRIAKAVLNAISHTRRGSGEAREEESTAIQWTLWGKQAENAAEYLSHGVLSLICLRDEAGGEPLTNSLPMLDPKGICHAPL